MNKKDAAIYKALAECGFEYGDNIPDPELDEMIKHIMDPEEQFLDAVERLFNSDPTKTD